MSDEPQARHWKINLNQDHIHLWKKMGGLWLIYMLFGLISGWHLQPRMDEIIFVLFLPIGIIIPYALACLILVALKQLWTVRFHGLPRRRLPGLKTNQSISSDSRS